MSESSSNSGLAVVTGASSGLGAVIARTLAARGHVVLAIARRGDQLNQVADGLEEYSRGRFKTLPVDLTAPGAVREIEQAVADLNLPLRYLVNCAGFNQPAGVEQLPWATHEALIRLNGLVPIELIRTLLPRLKASTPSRILNISSLAALRPGCPNVASYSASKTMLYRFSESLAAELSGSGVTVTVSCPGFIETEFFNSFVASEDMAEFMIRQKRFMMSPQLVAAQALYGADRGQLLVLHGAFNKFSVFLFKHLPAGLGRRLAAAMVRKSITSEVTKPV